jgi:hypothetical protein
LSILVRGFTLIRHRQGQLQLVWRSHRGHETFDLLTLSFNPFSGTVRAFDQHAGLSTHSLAFRPPLSAAGA